MTVDLVGVAKRLGGGSGGRRRESPDGAGHHVRDRGPEPRGAATQAIDRPFGNPPVDDATSPCHAASDRFGLGRAPFRGAERLSPPPAFNFQAHQPLSRGAELIGTSEDAEPLVPSGRHTASCCAREARKASTRSKTAANCSSRKPVTLFGSYATDITNPSCLSESADPALENERHSIFSRVPLYRVGVPQWARTLRHDIPHDRVTCRGEQAPCAISLRFDVRPAGSIVVRSAAAMATRPSTGGRTKPRGLPPRMLRGGSTWTYNVGQASPRDNRSNDGNLI